ncbi:MAG: hypothetical protein GYB58_18790 [Gammaproteobacteria bacterium]|nr:hypothetical protein [Gammaproteobacteria bacterium]
MNFEREYNKKIEELKRQFIASSAASSKREISREEKKILSDYIENVYLQETFESRLIAGKSDDLEEMRERYNAF